MLAYTEDVEAGGIGKLRRGDDLSATLCTADRDTGMGIGVTSPKV